MNTPVGADAEFIALVNSEHVGAIAAAAMIVGNFSVAEEIAQDVFERAYGRWPKIRDLDRPGAWIRRAVINQAISTTRRNQNERKALRRVETSQVIDLNPAWHSTDFELWEAVAELPTNQATALVLHYGSDLSIDVVATEMGLSTFAVKSLLHRARARLRESQLLKEESR